MDKKMGKLVIHIRKDKIKSLYQIIHEINTRLIELLNVKITTLKFWKKIKEHIFKNQNRERF